MPTMEALFLIVTMIFNDGSIRTQAFQAPAHETMENCKMVYAPKLENEYRNKVTNLLDMTTKCAILTTVGKYTGDMI
jgi:hypothetical protein